MNERKTVAVVIPIYKPDLTIHERLSLNQCLKVLCNHPIIFFAPQGLNVSAYKEAFKGIVSFEIEFFNKQYFVNVEGYNKLMLAAHFYERFIQYKYILIYQLDAWIFKDELADWCSKNYNYIGAPWIEHGWATHNARRLTIPRKILHKLGYKNFNLVGNGGLSLRKTKSFVINLKVFKKHALKFIDNEDAFFAFFINSYNPFFRIPSNNIALKFAFDINPDKAFKLNNSQLPMGCHAWEKNFNFWKEFISLPVELLQTP